MPVTYHGSQHSRVDPALQSASHVFLRVDAVKRPLVPPYIGPYLVLSKDPKTFIILKEDKKLTVSVDRLKPAFLSDSPSRSGASVSGVPAPRDQASALRPDPAPVFTSSGRVSRPVRHFQAWVFLLFLPLCVCFVFPLFLDHDPCTPLRTLFFYFSFVCSLHCTGGARVAERFREADFKCSVFTTTTFLVIINFLHKKHLFFCQSFLFFN